MVLTVSVPSLGIIKKHDNWLLFDDDGIELLDAHDIPACFGVTQEHGAAVTDTQCAYMLFYERRRICNIQYSHNRYTHTQHSLTHTTHNTKSTHTHTILRAHTITHTYLKRFRCTTSTSGSRLICICFVASCKLYTTQTTATKQSNKHKQQQNNNNKK